MMFYGTLLCFFAYTTKAQFPDHIDLEKLSEVEFHNEVYKILRPSLHKVTDYFKDVMTNTNTQAVNEKILMDNNGFRHRWGSLTEPKSKPKTKNDIGEKAEEDTVEIIKGLSHPKKSQAKEPRKIAKDKVILDAIMEQWKVDKDKVLNKKPVMKVQDKKLHPVETKILCPYFGLIKAKHFVEDEEESSILT